MQQKFYLLNGEKIFDSVTHAVHFALALLYGTATSIVGQPQTAQRFTTAALEVGKQSVRIYGRLPPSAYQTQLARG